jgi:BirA family transcriptional regulator, biotin operon repressor / biotin---[acetyl-CoA-carboxylase] ligase
MTASDLEQALSAAGLAAPVRFDEVTGSTNVTAAELAREGAPEWTLVGAGHQTAGKGRLGRTWEDVPGHSLIVSVILRPTLDPAQAGLLPLLGGAALALAAEEVAGLRARCKWPNDLLVGEDKAGGILVDSQVAGGRIEFAVLGLGVNLGRPPGVHGATGLGDAVDPARLLAAFLGGFREAYRPGGGEAFAAAVQRRWAAVSSTLGRPVRVTTLGGERVEGTATGIDPGGALLVRSPLGERAFVSGDVAHLR